MGAGKRFDLVDDKYAAVRGLPWSFPRMWLKQKSRHPVDLTGVVVKLRIYDPSAPASPIEIERADLGADGLIDGLALTADQVSGFTASPTYQLVLVFPGKSPRPYFRGLIKVMR